MNFQFFHLNSYLLTIRLFDCFFNGAGGKLKPSKNLSLLNFSLENPLVCLNKFERSFLVSPKSMRSVI